VGIILGRGKKKKGGGRSIKGARQNGADRGKKEKKRPSFQKEQSDVDGSRVKGHTEDTSQKKRKKELEGETGAKEAPPHSKDRKVNHTRGKGDSPIPQEEEKKKKRESQRVPQ